MRRLFVYFALFSTIFFFISCSFVPQETASMKKGQQNVSPISKTFTVDKTYGSHMVLQRDVPIVIRGTCEPGKAVNVFLGLEKDAKDNAETLCAKATPDGIWQAEFPAKPASGPYTIIVAGTETEAAVFNDVMVGEVWMCSGQSNMEMPVYSGKAWWGDQDYQTLLSEAKDFPQIRIFNAAPQKYVSPKVLQTQPKGLWQIADEESIKSFSATGYNFGKQLAKDLEGVAIGLINASWSGTRIEPWISRRAFEASDFQGNKHEISYLGMTAEELKKAEENTRREQFQWMERFEALAPADIAKEASSWKNQDYDDSTWETLQSPELFFPEGKDGAAWCRKAIEIPSAWVGHELILNLGVIDDCDYTYINGQEVGHTLIDTKSYWGVIRKYKIPASLVTSSNLLIAVRVLDLYNNGGFFNSTRPMYIGLDDTEENRISIKEDWKTHLEFTADISTLGPQPNTSPVSASDLDSCQYSTTLYNSMIHPWIHFPIRGVIWYQGCSNASKPGEYYQLQQLLVQNWREDWNNPDMPFIVTQLAAFSGNVSQDRHPDAWKKSAPGSSNYGGLREAQWYAVLRMHNTGMAVTLDIGNQYDIHPHNKKDVGYRLAKEAQRIIFNGPETSRGPILRHVRFDGKVAILTFDNCPGGLVVKSETPSMAGCFIIGDSKGHFAHAMACVQGNQIIVWAPEITHAAAVRYGWVSYTEAANLYNKDGFPASPFRTDLPDYITNPTFTVSHSSPVGNTIK